MRSIAKYFFLICLMSTTLFANPLTTQEELTASKCQQQVNPNILKRLVSTRNARLLARQWGYYRNEKTNIDIVKDMFSEFAEKRDMSKFNDYYTRNFALESNGKRYNYQQYKKLESDIFQTLTSLTVLGYKDIFASRNKVTARMNIELIFKNGQKKTFYVFLIALIKENKIQKIWELTYPQWEKN